MLIERMNEFFISSLGPSMWLSLQSHWLEQGLIQAKYILKFI